MEETNVYYVYAYLDPRKPGTYTYGDYTFDHEPFYIGKGKGDRMYDHLKTAFYDYSWNELKKNKIKKIIELELSPIIIQVVQGLTNQESYDIEFELISLIGRKVAGTGVLTNILPGGEARPEIRPETKAKISAGNKGKKPSPESTAKRVATRRAKDNYACTEETKEKLRQFNLGKKHSEETKAMMSEKFKGVYAGENNGMWGKKQTLEEIERRIKASSKYVYFIILPDGEIFTTHNLMSFCVEKGLNHGSVSHAIKKEQHHKGYLIFKFPKDEIIY